MAFIVDRKKYKTYDPDRGYELILEGGGSDGMVRFRLVGANNESAFSATTVGEKLHPDETHHLGENSTGRVVVWRIHNWPDGWRSLIREAMQAYIINHGSPLPNVTAVVRFGEAGGILNA